MYAFEIPVGDPQEPQESTCSCRCGCEVPLSGGSCVDCADGTHQNNNGLDEFRVCENATKWADLPHEKVEVRVFRTNYNGFEYTDCEEVDLCAECYEAVTTTGWNA